MTGIKSKRQPTVINAIEIIVGVIKKFVDFGVGVGKIRSGISLGLSIVAGVVGVGSK